MWTIGYATYHSLVKQHPSLNKRPTPTIYMLCYVHHMYLPTDINIWLSFHPILERTPNPYNVLSNFIQMSAHPGTSFTQLIECSRWALRSTASSAMHSYLTFVLYFTKGYYMVAFHRLTSKSDMHLLMVTCCCSKCRLLSELWLWGCW